MTLKLGPFTSLPRCSHGSRGAARRWLPTGGRGSVLGTLLVLLAISIVDNGMSLANITADAGQVFHPALLMIALVIDRPRHRRRSRSATQTGWTAEPVDSAAE